MHASMQRSGVELAGLMRMRMRCRSWVRVGVAAWGKQAAAHLIVRIAPLLLLPFLRLACA